ncbi:hypothetical protein D9615_006551 [Tricholomella constricta]|uniref:Integrase core domain-containing protein n=1 Tax=Tricholomella constricta TaxID=117010 RepID=A0A8H5HA22_9AGAR|nr:hypothetical protein D9615_006551 [Tricholomella constricta]
MKTIMDDTIPVPLETIRQAYFYLGRDVDVALRTQLGDVARLEAHKAECLRHYAIIPQEDLSIMVAGVNAMLFSLDEARTLSADPPDAPFPSATQFIYTGLPGRPRINIDHGTLTNALELRGPTHLAPVFGCSARTIRRRAVEYEILEPGHPVYVEYEAEDGSKTRIYRSSTGAVSQLEDAELDEIIAYILHMFPSFGRRMLDGHLKHLGHHIPRFRLQESYGRVHGAPASQFGVRRVERRVYSVPGPNSLWHHDGQHRVRAHTNNKPETVLKLFQEIIKIHGKPSRLRGDYGTENVLVAAFMEAIRGADRGSYIWRRSVHNIRIERLWRDLTLGFSGKWWNFFQSLEVHDRLNADSASHIWLLHHLFLEAINEDAIQWAEAWNHHVLSQRGQRQRSPRDMFFFGMMEHGMRGLPGEVLEPEVEDVAEFGIDWEMYDDRQKTMDARRLLWIEALKCRSESREPALCCRSGTATVRKKERDSSNADEDNAEDDPPSTPVPANDSKASLFFMKAQAPCRPLRKLRDSTYTDLVHPAVTAQLDVVFPSSNVLESAPASLKVRYSTGRVKLAQVIDSTGAFADLFLQCFTMLSTDAHGEDVRCIDSRGLLTLLVSKDTYARLGLLSKTLPFKAHSDYFVIHLPLQKNAESAANRARRSEALKAWDARREREGLGAWKVLYCSNVSSSLESAVADTQEREVQYQVTKYSDVFIPVPSLRRLWQPARECEGGTRRDMERGEKTRDRIARRAEEDTRERERASRPTTNTHKRVHPEAEDDSKGPLNTTDELEDKDIIGTGTNLTRSFGKPWYLITSIYASKGVLLAWTAGNSLVFGEYILKAANKEPISLPPINHPQALRILSAMNPLARPHTPPSTPTTTSALSPLNATHVPFSIVPAPSPRDLFAKAQKLQQTTSACASKPSQVPPQNPGSKHSSHSNVDFFGVPWVSPQKNAFTRGTFTSSASMPAPSCMSSSSWCIVGATLDAFIHRLKEVRFFFFRTTTVNGLNSTISFSDYLLDTSISLSNSSSALTSIIECTLAPNAEQSADSLAIGRVGVTVAVENLVGSEGRHLKYLSMINCI